MKNGRGRVVGFLGVFDGFQEVLRTVFRWFFAKIGRRVAETTLAPRGESFAALAIFA